jgi:hypothetical protein
LSRQIERTMAMAMPMAAIPPLAAMHPPWMKIRGA